MFKLTPTRSFTASAGSRSEGVKTAGISSVLVLLCFCLTFTASPTKADVGVLLNESLDTSFARISGSGHSAVYFSRICAESPVKLRLCRPDEQGSVMSNYTTLGEDQPFEWNIVPLSVYLYGVEDPQNRPLFSSQKIKHALEERYRTNFLAGYCDSETCRTSNKAEWREMVGATLERSLYIFVVQTSLEQDRAFVEAFNAQPNKNHFNGVTQNCATFARRVMNSYYPHSTRADYLNDFGLITPKAIARSFDHYADSHPEAHLRVMHFAQLPGTIKRSTECRNADEQLYRSKKLLVPMVLFAPHELPFMAASYMLTARFNPEHELEQHPTAEAADIKLEIHEAKAQNDGPREQQLKAAVSQESAEVVGTDKEWKSYRDAFGPLADEAVNREIIRDRDALGRLFKDLDRAGTLSVDANGSLWLEIAQGGKPSKIGLSASNILASGADPQLAYALTLARANHYLNSPKHSREIMPDFKIDWALVQSARRNNSISSAANDTLPSVGARAIAVSFNQYQ